MPPDNYTPALTYLQALILGIVQGVTEFLPVSSTAHMRVLPALLHHFSSAWPNDTGAAFSAIVQLGPIAGIIAYFHRDLARYAAGVLRSFKAGQLFPKGDVDARLGWYSLLGTIPLIIAGLALEKKVDKDYRSLYVIAGALILLALILLVAERIGRRNRNIESLTFREAMIIGLTQALALVPGASRSGCTITSGLFLGLDREDAARFSFLLSIPAITLAGLYKLGKTLFPQYLGDAAKAGAPPPSPPDLSHVAGPYLFATLVAGILAYVVVRSLMGYLSDEKNSTMPFIVYRIVLGLALIGLVQAHVLPAVSH